MTRDQGRREAVIGKISGSYYAKGRSVWRSPEKTPNGFKMGFRVCDLSDGVEDDGAQEIADALNAHDLEDQRDALQAENARLRMAITDMLDGYEDYDLSSGKAVRCPPDRQTSWCRRARAALEAKP